ncbi:MAG: FAD-binding protein [Bacteroidales bacterium]
MIEFEYCLSAMSYLDEKEVKKLAAKKLRIPASDVCFRLKRKSLDARSREIKYRYQIQSWSKDDIESENQFSKATLDKKYLDYKDVTYAKPIIIVGCGPSGLFAALKAIRLGIKPILLERGKDVHARKKDISAISLKGLVNEDSNYCFGEGGAGTFSDGKLFTRSNKRGDLMEILYQFVHFGADPSILVEAHPHIGTDKLSVIIENIRYCIEEHGGEYHFNTCMTSLKKVSGKIAVSSGSKISETSIAKSSNKVTTSNKVITNDKWIVNNEFEAENVILATGHSAKDVYEMLNQMGWELQPKGFALGVRVEHPQSLINDIQYHNNYHPSLPVAEYSLVTQIENRGVFSFCMCPGGNLVPAATSPKELALNGMSNSLRNSKWANAGIVVSIEPEDIQVTDALSMLKFQRDVEKKAFSVSNSLAAPSQRMTDFVEGKLSSMLPESSYVPGLVSSDLNQVLPDIVARRLKKAFLQFNQKKKGFYTNEALLLACESRTSSPVRIPRDKVTLEHIKHPGIYPCGEGAGYAGGIVSSAIDGINCVLKIYSKN